MPDQHDRRQVLTLLAALPMAVALARADTAEAQAAGSSPVKVDTKALTARIRFESPLSGYLTELNGRYKLRVTELTLEPGGYVGEHNHAGPGIRLMTMGEMTYVLPDKTIIYKAGDFFFESGDVNHTVFNKTDRPNQHLLFEILPVDLKGRRSCLSRSTTEGERHAAGRRERPARAASRPPPAGRRHARSAISAASARRLFTRPARASVPSGLPTGAICRPLAVGSDPTSAPPLIDAT